MTRNTLLYTIIIAASAWLGSALAQESRKVDWRKMSPLVREAALSQPLSADAGTMQTMGNKAMANRRTTGRSICAFVKATGNANETLRESGCRTLAQFSDIYIADIPLSRLATLSQQDNVLRIEASEHCSLTLDTALVIVNGTPLHTGQGLPQAYTGRGVVVGLMDVGFELTNPNFLDANLEHSRIKRFWDQLSPDSLSSSLYVGADYCTEDAIANYARSHDGLTECHGTHTMGIAAGGGVGTPYCGMAYGADLCAVSNAVTSNAKLIPDELRYRYTSATDVLGFKYLFDYADEVGKPCVVSFSESSTQGLDADEQLYQQALASMTGAGRLLVASAGNNGEGNTYAHKPQGTESDGMFILQESNAASLSMTASAPCEMRLKTYAYGKATTILTIPTERVCQAEDSVLIDSIMVSGKMLKYAVGAYPTYFDPQLTAFDVVIRQEGGIGIDVPLSLEAVGAEADVQFFAGTMKFYASQLNPSLCGGERAASVGSPACAPSVIAVGATAWRDHSVNYEGTPVWYNCGEGGEVASYSSRGPTRDGLVKPDVVAPGTFVVSSSSSFYTEANPDDAKKDIVGFTEYGGRQYPWASFVGTSMSAPVVAGIIAQWLEANPTLTKEQIMDIFAATCRKDGTVSGKKDNQWGYGEIDAYAGLLKVLQLDNIREITPAQPTALSIQWDGNELRIASPKDEGPASIAIYTASGKKIAETSIRLSHSAESIRLNHLPSGVYAVQINGQTKGTTGSLLIRRQAGRNN